MSLQNKKEHGFFIDNPYSVFISFSQFAKHNGQKSPSYKAGGDMPLTTPTEVKGDSMKYYSIINYFVLIYPIKY